MNAGKYTPDMWIDDITITENDYKPFVGWGDEPRDEILINFDDFYVSYDIPCASIKDAPARDGKVSKATYLKGGEYNYNVVANYGAVTQYRDPVFTVPCKPETLYEFSYYIYVPQKTGSLGYFAVYYDWANTWALRASGMTERDQWVKKTSFFATKPNQTQLSFTFIGDKVIPDIYLDDILLKELKPNEEAQCKVGDCIWSLKNTTLTISGNGEIINDSQFDSLLNYVTDVVIEEGITSISNTSLPYYASLEKLCLFKKYSQIKNITVADNNMYFSSVDGVLFNKDKTELICYPTGKTDINYVIPNTVTLLHSGAFYSCNNLVNIIIPNTITVIGNMVFDSCTNLTNIFIPQNVISIGDYVFSFCSNLESITVDKNNKSYTSVDGVLFNKDKTDLICYPTSKTDTTYAVPDGVEYIIKESFANCKNLTNITIPSSVIHIGSSAFYGLDNLTDITLLDSKTTIGVSAFRKCKKLVNVNLGTEIILINSYAFFECSSLESIIIPDCTTSIGQEAFGSCVNLKNITIGKNVITIDDWAFYNCSALAEVYYKGTEKNRAYMLIDDYNDSLEEAIWHYNSCNGSAEHIYDNVCDAYCNGCDFERSVTEHIYDDIHDYVCNICGYKNYISGDINADQIVNLCDLVLLAQYNAKWNVECNEDALDVNKDGTTNLNDVIHLSRYLAGWGEVELN